MEINDNKRLKLLYGIIKEIHNWSFEKCEQVYTEMIPSLKHNQLLSHKMDLKHKKIRYTPDTYLRYKSKQKKLFYQKLI